MKRREFIGIAAAGAAGLVVPATALDVDAMPGALARPRLLAILDGGVVCALGRRYRELVPAESDASTLTQAILGDAPALPSGPLRAQLDAQVQLDFAQGRTVTLNGWVLSLTEARQSALLSLLAA